MIKKKKEAQTIAYKINYKDTLYGKGNTVTTL